MGENVCKQGDEQRINLPNIQTAHAAQLRQKKKANQLNQKMSRRSK